MPVATLTYKPERIDRPTLLKIRDSLRAIVAAALDCEEYRCQPEGIGIDVHPLGADSIMDDDFRLHIEGCDSKERADNLDDRQRQIGEAIAALLPAKGIVGNVWIKLWGTSSFDTITGPPDASTTSAEPLICINCRQGRHDMCDRKFSDEKCQCEICWPETD